MGVNLTLGTTLIAMEAENGKLVKLEEPNKNNTSIIK